MPETHWSEDQVIAELYGVGPGDDHLSHCPQCRSRVDRLMQERQKRIQGDLPVSYDFLAAQRRCVLARLDARAAWWQRPFLIPATALLALILVLSMLNPFRWSGEPQDTGNTSYSDSTVFEDAFARAYSTEPEFSEPLQALFEVKP